jgi:hypothetical protein
MTCAKCAADGCVYSIPPDSDDELDEEETETVSLDELKELADDDEED